MAVGDRRRQGQQRAAKKWGIVILSMMKGVVPNAGIHF